MLTVKPVGMHKAVSIWPKKKKKSQKEEKEKILSSSLFCANTQGSF